MRQWHNQAVEFNRRVFVIRRMLQIPEVRWNCYVVLNQSSQPISEAALAAHLFCSRTTIRQHMQLPLAIGYVERTTEGLVPTEIGALLIQSLIHLTTEIALGNQTGISEEGLIHVLKGLSGEARDKALEPLRTVQFSPRFKTSLAYDIATTRLPKPIP